MQEMQVPSLIQEDPLEKEMEIYSSILAWRIPWTEEPGKLHSPWGRKELDVIWSDLACMHPGKGLFLSTLVDTTRGQVERILSGEAVQMVQTEDRGE